MDPSFWHSRWAANETGFYQAEVNPHLAAHFAKLTRPPAPASSSPLCGMALDFAWIVGLLFNYGNHRFGTDPRQPS
jgi:thiopurine S-methyltransferase